MINSKILAVYTGAKYAVAIVNGTSALHIALLLAGVKMDDEVLVPTLTFVASANAISYCGATPHFVDSEETTLGIATAKLRDYLQFFTEQNNGQCVNSSTGKVVAPCIMDILHPCDMDGLLEVARDFNITLIEDAGESLGSTYNDQHITFGSMARLVLTVIKQLPLVVVALY